LTHLFYTRIDFYTTSRFGENQMYSVWASCKLASIHWMKQLTPCSGIELEKLRLIQLIKKFHASKITQHHWDLAIPRNLLSPPDRSKQRRLVMTPTPGALPVLCFASDLHSRITVLLLGGAVLSCLFLLSDKHNYTDHAYYFIFDSITCFGCSLQPSSCWIHFTKRVE